MKQRANALLVIGALCLVAAPATATAHENQSLDDSVASPATTTREVKPSELREKVEAQKKERQEKAQAAKTETKQKLSDAKRKACDTRESRANTIMKNMDDRRQRAYDHITKVYENVKSFYTTKELSIANYDELTTTVDAAQSAAQSAMTAQQDTPELNCDGDHPRADIVDFKAKRLGSIDAMQTYRQAVKELIKAVKTAVQANKESQS